MASDIPLEIRVLETIKEKKPNLRNQFDAVVAVLHCSMREMGFICTGLEEKACDNGNNNNFNHDIAYHASYSKLTKDIDDFDKQVFSEGWNKSNDTYQHTFTFTKGIEC